MQTDFSLLVVVNSLLELGPTRRNWQFELILDNLDKVSDEGIVLTDFIMHTTAIYRTRMEQHDFQ